MAQRFERETLYWEKDGHLAQIVLNRPERLNAQDVQWTRDLTEATADVGADDAIRVVILRGSGRAFCAGLNLKLMAQEEFPWEFYEKHEAALKNFEDMDKMVIAAVNGHCVGGGVQVIAACDIRIARTDARFFVPAVQEALPPGMATYRLPRLIGLGPAKRVLLLGQPFDAAEAYRIGLIDYLAPPERFEAQIMEVAEVFLRYPGTGVHAAKRLMSHALDTDRDAFMDTYYYATLRACLDSPEYAAARDTMRDRERWPSATHKV